MAVDIIHTDYIFRQQNISLFLLTLYTHRMYNVTKFNMSNEAKPNKSRVNILLSEEVLALGKRMAKAEQRSFSNLLEVLVVREANRHSPLVPALADSAGAKFVEVAMPAKKEQVPA